MSLLIYSKVKCKGLMNLQRLLGLTTCSDNEEVFEVSLMKTREVGDKVLEFRHGCIIEHGCPQL